MKYSQKIEPSMYGDKTDYSKKENWLKIPEITKEVDVFYIYPAAYLSPDDEFLPFSNIHDETVMKAAKYFLMSQAGAFEKSCNVFSPYYRQFDPRVAIEYIKADRLDEVAGIWSKDIVDSFDYYIKNFNQGRPFILAGHSQGARLHCILLETYLKENKDVYDRMVAGYLIGDSVTEKYLEKNSHLKFAQGADDIGVLISWNTEHVGITEDNPVLQKGAIAINPINWSRGEEVAPQTDNLGSLLRKDVIRPGVCDAKVNLERGSVQISTVNPDDFKPAMDIFPKGTYHIMDFGFFFGNIEENAQVRIDAFLKNR